MPITISRLSPPTTAVPMKAYERIEEHLASRLECDAVLSEVRLGLPAIPDKLDVVQSMDDIHRKPS